MLWTHEKYEVEQAQNVFCTTRAEILSHFWVAVYFRFCTNRRCCLAEWFTRRRVWWLKILNDADAAIIWRGRLFQLLVRFARLLVRSWWELPVNAREKRFSVCGRCRLVATNSSFARLICSQLVFFNASPTAATLGVWARDERCEGFTDLDERSLDNFEIEKIVSFTSSDLTFCKLCKRKKKSSFSESELNRYQCSVFGRVWMTLSAEQSAKTFPLTFAILRYPIAIPIDATIYFISFGLAIFSLSVGRL